MASSNARCDRFLIGAMALALLAFFSIAAGPPVLRSGDVRPIRLYPAQVQSMSEIIAGPEVAARSAILVDDSSGEKLWGKDENAALPMASTTKMMTALVALETLSPDQVVTVPQAALIGDASMGLQAGDGVTVETLLYGALLPSGNDAAMTLALAAAGTTEAFVERMNARAADWGLTQTHFENPHGLDEPGHISSATDLAGLARQVLDSPVLAKIVATPQTTQQGYALTSTNELLTTYPGANGVKTGTTDEAGQVLVAAATRRGGSPLSVVLNSPDRFAESARLLDFYFDHWAWLHPRLQSDALNRVTGPDGKTYAMRTPDQPTFLPRWQADQLRDFRQISFDAVNQPSGMYEVWLGERKLSETPITFLAQPDFVSDSTHASE
ncbi:MAG: D-alanyl-D-alanine carboxypeptidase [Caldilineales bacterium]|nr:D-alanyl-D-alanine carboxypeptidase [Caldilineales bacterium]